MSGLQPNDNTDIQAFFAWTSTAACRGILGAAAEVNSSFIPYPSVQAYFREGNRVSKLLRALFPRGESQVDAETIQRKYSLVFSILLLINKGRYIQNFVRHHGLCDDRLPFEQTPPEHFPITPEDPGFFTSFRKTQWMFCAPRLEYKGVNLHFERERILPITHKEQIAGEGSAVVYMIKVHEAYNRLHPDGNARRKISAPLANVFVLKTYRTKDAEKYYNNEVSAFTRLASARGLAPNLIGFYGSYVQDSSFNIILEYADRGTLERYFQTVRSPSKGADIIEFWENLFKVIAPLISIHELEPIDSELQVMQGWHQDVKPANILVTSCNRLSPYEWQFKLADLGLSHFKWKVMGQREATDADSYGTRAYGAPECCRTDAVIENSKLAVKQNIDIWSLGCVFSEAAVWVVHGGEGLLDYRRARMAETSQIDGVRDGDCFHNGEDVLQAVQDTHENLSRDFRASDHITGAVLELVKDMLDNADGRPTATQLWRKSQRILKDARKKAGVSTAGGSSEGSSHAQPQLPPERPTPLLWQTQTAPSRPPQVHQRGSSSSADPRSQRWTVPNRRAQVPRSGLGIVADAEGEGHSATGNTASDIFTSPERFRRSPSNEEVPDLRNDGSPQQHAKGMEESVLDQSSLQQGFSPEHPSGRGGAQAPSRDNHGSIRDRQRKELCIRSEGGPDKDKDLPPHPDANKPSCHDAGPNGASGPSNQGQMLGARYNPDPTPSEPAIGQDNLPVWWMDEALQWKSDKKNSKTMPLPHEQLLKSLNKRDHMFLIDNAESMMKNHWKEVQAVFGLLAYIVKNLDPDGYELLFTMSTDRYKSKKTKKIAKILEKMPTSKGFSDMRECLGSILQDYQNKLDQQATPKSGLGKLLSPAPVRRLSLYILTDGVWQPHTDVEMPIRNLVDKLVELKLPVEQMGIQLISFGNDSVGLGRLKKLDSGLGLALDIVDTESSKGNVLKMLHGPTNDWFDGDSKSDNDNRNSVASAVPLSPCAGK